MCGGWEARERGRDRGEAAGEGRDRGIIAEWVQGAHEKAVSWAMMKKGKLHTNMVQGRARLSTVEVAMQH